jgi:hypothetical protein
MTSNIHLTTKDGFEWFQSFLFPAIVDSFAIIKEFLDAKHIAVVGNGHTFHAISDSFIYEFFDTRLPVKY